MSTGRTVLYLAFAAVLSSACFLRPVPDDFDRYIYEALVRGRYESAETIYSIIKHENPRAENSSVLDSPTHLRQLEPLYAIRPTYVDAIAMFSSAGIPIQRSINLVSALSFFGIAIVLLAFTGSPFYCALLLATPTVLVIARMGTPDALSTLMLIAAFWALTRDRLLAGVSLMILSVWVRTDNVLLVIAALGWLVWKRKLSALQSSLFALAALGSVLFINQMVGNYGWTVLFRYSFIGGKYPAEMSAQLTLSEYVRAFTTGLQSIVPQLAPWLLLGAAAWKWQSRYRELLPVVAVTALVHFILYPSPEGRYLVWAYLITGIAFIAAVNPPAGETRPVQETRATLVNS